MSTPDVGIFRKQLVIRQSATSILTSLLSSPKTSSPELASPSDAFGDSDTSSRTGSSSPLIRTPPRRACISFAAAQPKASPDSETNFQNSNELRHSSDAEHYSQFQALKAQPPSQQPSINSLLRSPKPDDIPVLGSVFDEYGENRTSPVIRDYYRVGQPKKLVDDCLKKEKALRVVQMTDEGDDREDGYYGNNDDEEDLSGRSEER